MAKVESIGKFGFVADGKKYKYDEVTTDRVSIIPGAEIELFYRKTDANVINMTADTPLLDKPVTQVDTERAKRFLPKFAKKSDVTSAGLSKDEWRQKDERISRQGVIQVAVQVQSDFDEAMKLADLMLEYVNRNTPKS